MTAPSCMASSMTPWKCPITFLLAGKRITHFSTAVLEGKIQAPDRPFRQSCILVKHFCDVADERIF